MKILGVIVGWSISTCSLSFALWLILAMAGLPASLMGTTLAAIILPFFLAIGVTLNPLVFRRLPLARTLVERFAVAASIVALSTFAGYLVARFAIPHLI
jgi:hypothetical protein